MGFGRYRRLTTTMFVAEPRAPENVHDPGENVRDVHDDAGGPLRQRQSFPQQHTRGGRRPVHQRTAELAGARGESEPSDRPTRTTCYFRIIVFPQWPYRTGGSNMCVDKISQQHMNDTFD